MSWYICNQGKGDNYQALPKEIWGICSIQRQNMGFVLSHISLLGALQYEEDYSEKNNLWDHSR